MKPDHRKPSGVRITTSNVNGKVTFYLNRTAKSGEKQNSPHTTIQPLRAKIINRCNPIEIGGAVLAELNLNADE